MNCNNRIINNVRVFLNNKEIDFTDRIKVRMTLIESEPITIRPCVVKLIREDIYNKQPFSEKQQKRKCQSTDDYKENPPKRRKKTTISDGLVDQNVC